VAKEIEGKYRKLTDIEHILQRSSMYIGSIKPHSEGKYILGENGTMEFIPMTYNPGFLKIFDEIITNSCDEHKREDSKLNTIKVNINTEENIISIWDNGGLPIVKHKEHKEWIPEMVFSNLKAGSSFNDDEDRTTAGTNGVGAVLTNVFSKEFSITTCDGKNQFFQTFSNNMRDRSKVVITKGSKGFTKISYKPDLEKFGLSTIDEDHLKMIHKRVLDIAGCNPSIKIYFNDKLINIKSFEDYVKLYTPTYFYETNKDKSWSIAIAPSSEGFQQISFANSTDTYDGGTHVDYVLNQIIAKLREFFQKKHKVDIKPSELKNHIFLFLNSTIINSGFSSQTKEKLITEVKDFGYQFEISDKLVKDILKSEIVNSILDWIQQKKAADENKLARDLNKNLSKIKVDKLIDAKSKDRWKCSLALFEGDCLHENTQVRVIRDGDIIDTEIKNVNLEDLVITHNNTISNICALTKKIKKKAIIKIDGEEIICSHKHKWFVYDIEKNEFYFELTNNINKEKHKLVKNYLAFTDALLEIKSNDGYTIELKSGEIIDTNPEHQFAIYNKIENKFKMKSCGEIDITVDFLVSTFKL
jgi:DNA topoisomerase-2